MTPSKPTPDTGPVQDLTDDALAFDLPRRQKVVLVMDLVESVRLMAANETAVVQRWHGFVQHARGHVLPRHHGRHVKSLGDGLLAEFDSASEAVGAAHELHHFFDDTNAALPPEQRFHLRAGLNAAQIYIDSVDVYGAGVNLAARVASLAGPGETIVTSQVRDDLTDGLDGELRDMGECYLKHVPEPVRVWRVGDASAQPLLTPEIVAATSEALRWSGLSIVDLGATTAPALVATQLQQRGAASLYIGQSRQPAHEVTLQIWGPDARPWSVPGTLEAVRDLALTSLDRPTRRAGTAARGQIASNYLERLRNHYHALRPLRIVRFFRRRAFLLHT